MKLPKEVQKLRERADHFRERAREFDREADELLLELLEESVRENKDKLLNRTQAIELLWFTTHQALKDWENKVAGLGYLNFQDNKILRSEVLRFRDDYQSGKLHEKLRKAGRR